jgi:hypothetical protein
MSETRAPASGSRPIPSPAAAASDRSRVSTRAAAGTDSSKSGIRRFGSLAAGFAKKIVGGLGESYREGRREAFRVRESEVMSGNISLLQESAVLQSQQNDLLAKIIAEMKDLSSRPGGGDGDLGVGTGGKGKTRGQRGKYGQRGRDRLARAQEARKARAQSAARPAPPTTRVTPPPTATPAPASSGIGGGVKSALGRLLGPAFAVGSGAYDAYTGVSQANEDLAAGRITESEASQARGAAVGGGVGGAGGAIAGAAIGAAAGSFVPIVGTAIGAAVGGAAGYFAGSRVGQTVGEAGVRAYQGIRDAVGGSRPSAGGGQTPRISSGTQPRITRPPATPALGEGAGAMMASPDGSDPGSMGLVPQAAPAPARSSSTPTDSFGRQYAEARAARDLAEQDLTSFRERMGPARTRLSSNPTLAAEGVEEEYYEDSEVNQQFKDLQRNVGRTDLQRLGVQRQHREAAIGSTSNQQQQLSRMVRILKERFNYTDAQILRLPDEGGGYIGGVSANAIRNLFQRHMDEELSRSADAAVASATSAPAAAATRVQGTSTGSGTRIPASSAESEPAPSAGAAPPASSGSGSSTSRPRPGGGGILQGLTQGILGRRPPASGPSAQPQQTSATPATPSVGGGSGGGAGGSTGTITEIVEKGPGFNVVKYDDGRIERRTGARNWRNNNPGNIEFGDFARRYGAIGTDGRFAIFPTYEMGKRAKEALIFEGRGYSGLTIAQAITRYAPPSENDTAMYIRVAATAAGVSPSTPIQNLNSEQRQAFLAAMERVEGFRVGSVQVLQQGGTAVAAAGQGSGPGPELVSEGTQMAAADQAQVRGHGQEVVVQIPPATAPQRLAETDRPAPGVRGEIPLNRRLEKQVA